MGFNISFHQIYMMLKPARLNTLTSNSKRLVRVHLAEEQQRSLTNGIQSFVVLLLPQGQQMRCHVPEAVALVGHHVADHLRPMLQSQQSFAHLSRLQESGQLC